MTAVGVPTGPAGPGPSGPAGPHPSGPAGPSGPPSKLAEALDAITLLLRVAQLVAERDLSGVDPAARMALAERLRLARRAVADLQTPAQPIFAAAVAGPVKTTRWQAGECLTPGYGAATRTAAVTESAGGLADSSAGASSGRGGPDRAGEPPLPGTGSFSLPPTPGVRPFPSRTEPYDFGVGRALYDVLPGRSS